VKRVLLSLVVVVVVVVAGAAAAIYWFLSGDGMRRAIEEQATAFLGQPVRIASATAQVFPRVAIQLRDVKLGEPARVTLADVEVSTGLRALLSRRVEDGEIIVSDSRIDMPLPFSMPTSGDAAASTDASTSSSMTVASIRAIRLNNVRVVSRGREIVVSAESSLIGSRLNLSSFNARAGRTSLQASGIVDLEPSMDAKLTASANDLDLDDLLALADAFTPPPPPKPQSRRAAPLVSGRIAAKLSADKGRAAGVEVTKLTGQFLAEGDHVTLSPVSFELFGGRYDGAVRANVGRQLAISLTSRLTKLDVAKLAAFGGVADTISGTMSGSGRFTGNGGDMTAALASVTGNGDVEITNGNIKRLNLVRTVVLYFGRPAADAPHSAGEHFDRISAPFTISQQVVRSDSLTMQSPDVDINASGTLSIPTKALDGRADLLLSESLTKQAGTDLVRFTREGDRVVLPATLGGTLAQPSVMIDAGAAVKRGIRNEVERRLKGLFDRLKPPQ
jgi:uncharacterized protein involved in outer membrane biogenesis